MIPQIDTETLKSEMLDDLKKAEEKEKSTFDFKKSYTNEKKFQPFIRKVNSIFLSENNLLRNIREGKIVFNLLKN